MRKLCENDKQALLDYISSEPEMTLLIYGDVENHGLDGDICEVFAFERDGNMDAVILRYIRSYIVYSRDNDFDAEEVAEFLRSRAEVKVISGKTPCVNRLQKYLPDFSFNITYMSRCNKPELFEHKAKGVQQRLVTVDDAMKVVRLFCCIDEFKENYIGHEEECAEEERVTISSGATCLGIFAGDELVSYAQTSAENSRSSMVIGVATLPEWRGLGLASANVSELCRIQFEAGREFICLFYSNPKAGRIYNKIGFTEIGEYSLARPKKEELK